MKEVCIRESKIRAKAKRADIILLENKITQAQNELIRVPNTQHALDEKRKTEKSLDDYHIEKSSLIL